MPCDWAANLQASEIDRRKAEGLEEVGHRVPGRGIIAIFWNVNRRRKHCYVKNGKTELDAFPVPKSLQLSVIHRGQFTAFATA